MKNKVGRPKLAAEDRQKYQRVALYPETHTMLKELKVAYGEDIIDVVHKLVKKAHIKIK